jgi:hypothetical protein
MALKVALQKNIVAKPKGFKSGRKLTKSSKECCLSKSDVLSIMMTPVFSWRD